MDILKSVIAEVQDVQNLKDLESLRIKYLGKQGLVNSKMKQLVSLNNEMRKKVGLELNALKQEIMVLITKKQTTLDKQALRTQFMAEKLDLSMPARPRQMGSIHPITQCMEELIAVFAKFGFSMRTGPDIETDWYNFIALNIDEHHPARQLHDTFYLQSGELLRTQTSPIQIRTMQAEAPPYRFIAPGRTYRADSDTTHTPMFHQIEGLVIDNDIHMGHLKYVVTEFIKTFFEIPNIEIRFRPSFFPFTEPSLEIDIRRHDNESWLEVLGCGMVHPQVLKNVDINPEQYQGFAFGLGVERFAMLKYNIRDLRQMFESDIRWLKHYSFASLDIPSLSRGLTR